MTISSRGQFIAAAVAMVCGVAALTVYGSHALESVAEDGDRIHDDLRTLQVVSDLEDDLRDLGAGSAGGDIGKLLVRLDGNMAKFDKLTIDPADDRVVETFRRKVAEAREGFSTDLWFRAGEATGAIEGGIIRRSQNWETMKHAHRNAKYLLLGGGGVVAVLVAAFAFFFVRRQREQRDAQERLRRSDRLAALGTIAASVAHEINNPLATISGCATAVRDRMRRRPDACVDSLEYLGMIEDETRRCTGIVKSLRDLARDGPPAMAPAELVKLARSVVALLEVDRKAKQVEFVVDGEEQVEAICDPDKIKQLLLNLLINARDASTPGGTVTVRVERIGASAARIEVRDEGRGIERRDLQRIFEPFHTDKTQGLGIGLFLCERIAAMHGGAIHAQSEGPGKGARFVVELPTRVAATMPAPTPAR